MSERKISVYFEFNRDVQGCLYENIATINAHSNSENLWATSTANLNEAWISSDIDPATGKESKASQDVHGIKTNDDVQNIITGDDFKNIAQWSSALITLFLEQLASHYDKDKGPLQMSAIQQLGSIISAKSSKEVAPGDSEIKTVGSEVTNDASAGTPFSNAGDAFTGVLSSWASSQATISA